MAALTDQAADLDGPTGLVTLRRRLPVLPAASALASTPRPRGVCRRQSRGTGTARVLTNDALAREFPVAARDGAGDGWSPAEQLIAIGHPCRHFLATQLLEQGQDIRTIQELMGHSDLNPTMIDTHVLKRGPLGVISPAD